MSARTPSPPNAPLAPPPPRKRGRQAGVSAGFAPWLGRFTRGTNHAPLDPTPLVKPRVRVCRQCSGPGSERPWWDWRAAQASGLCYKCQQEAAKETR